MKQSNMRMLANLETYLRPPHLVGPSRYSYQQEIKKILPGIINDDDKVLDFGAGNGNNRFFFEGWDLKGFDISEASIKKITDHDGYFVADGQSVDMLTDESVDFIYCNWVLEYIPDPSRALGEMYRLLRPGGRAYLGLPTPLEKIVNEGGALFLRLINGRKNLMVDGADEIYFSCFDIKQRLANAGFDSVEIHLTAGPCISLMKLLMIYLNQVRLVIVKIFIELPLRLYTRIRGLEWQGSHLAEKVKKAKGSSYPTIDTSKQKSREEFRNYLESLRLEPVGFFSRIYVLFLKLAHWVDIKLPDKLAFEIAVVARKDG